MEASGGLGASFGVSCVPFGRALGAFLESREVVLGSLVRLVVFWASEWALVLYLGSAEAISMIFQEIPEALLYHFGRCSFGYILRSKIESEI